MAGSSQQEKRELWKRLSLDSSLVEHMDSNKCIEELLKQLEEERRSVRREKLAAARLQREVARSKSEGTMREKLIHELEEERRLRLESEKRLGEVTVESEQSTAHMLSLQQQLSRVEETVRNLLQNQGALDQTAVDTVDIMKVYKGKLSEGVKKPKEVVEDLNLAAEVDYPSEGSGNEEEKDKTTLLLERLRALEAENSALTTENETQRQQYERCLDEVANQVVQALLTQKDLREECLKLRTRVFDLEQQNRTLSVLFQQRVRPASDLLLQRLHSRIMDLSAGDLLSEPERSKSFLQLRTTETDIHESQQNVKSEIPVFKCQSQLGLTVPTQLYPRSSCSSSELSLSSACSEYSSGSYTWNDGKLCSKRSSLNWEKRVSIGSSAPNVSSPAKEQLPTRRKESHILEGLKKLQKRKPMEPPSLISKWGYKDCMNSNEGIYSPGIKCVGRGAPKSHLPNKPVGMCMSRELGKKIAYDYDSHDDADDESTNTPTLPYDLPSKDCRTFCKKLTHSVSDSLFSWGHSGKSMMGRKPSYFNSARPEKLTSFINGLFLSEKTCTSFKPPVLKFKASPTDLDCALQLSDIDDLEVLEDLHVESGDDTSSKVNQLAEKRAKGGSNRLSNEFDKLPLPQCEKDLSRSSQLDSRPKTFNVMKQNKVVRKTSSEECITVIFDAEDGEPIELSSHQTGVVSVTRNEISVNQQQTISTAEYTELIPQGMANCQKGSNVRNYSVLESPQNKAEQQPDNMAKKNVILSSVCTDTPSSERLLPHIPQQPKLIKPAYNNAHKLNYVPSMQTASSQRTNLTKIPSSGKGSPQKVSKTSASETSNNNGTSSSSCQEKSPSSPPVKLSRFIKSPGGGCNQSPKAELVVSKHNAQSQQSSKIPCRNDWGKGSYTGVPGSPLLPRRHMESVDYGEPPTRDRNCDPGQAELRSPSPPPPPGRSASLLIRPNYENTPPLALKPGTHLSTSNASRGGSAALLHHHNQPPQVDVQHQSPQMMQDTAELDASHCAEPAPQKLVDNVTQQLQSSPGAHQTPTKGSPKRFSVKMYHPSSTSGLAQGVNEPTAKSSKNISCLYNPQKGSSLQNTFTSKKGLSCENGLPLQYKISSSLPISLQSHSQSTIEPHGTQGHGSQVTPTSPGAENSLQITEEKVVKTRIPIGLKVLVKSPLVLRKSITVPGKQEKDNINTASKGTVTSNNFRQCDALQGTRCFEMVTAKSDQEIRSDIQESYLNEETLSPVLNDSESPVADKGDGESRLFKRSVSVTNKPHLMPALGMNGAKARSQSFSAHTGDKTCTSVTEGPGKIRTQIITNTTGRGSSLPGQNSSIEGFQLTPGSRPSESPSRSPRGVDHSHSRQSSYGSMSSLSSHQGSPSKVASRTTPKEDGPQNGSKYEGNKSPPQKEARSLPLADRLGLRNSRQRGKSQPQFDSVSPSHFLPEQASESIGSRLLNPSRIEIMRPAKKSDNPTRRPEVPEQLSPSVSTIEEKVMMGIQENMQKGQGKEKSQVTETKLKTGSSLASWFGFRRSKLPALSGKKTDASKAKEEKKEVKIGSVLGNKQMKSDRKKDKKNEQYKDSQGHTTKPENNDKVVSIMDHCNTKIGPPMKQLQPSTTKDQFMKELLNRVDKTENGSNHVSYRSMSKGSSQDSSLPTISISTQGNHKKMNADMEMHNETVTKIVTQKINIMADDDEETIPKPSCQDHMLGSSCQMRTLDSGIGTFPLPDSVTRATGRHLPKSQSNPEKVVTVSPEPDEILPQITLPKAKTLEREMPSTSETCQQELGAVCHSLPDPTMAAKAGHTFQSRLPTSTTSGIMKPKGVHVKKLNPVGAKSPDSDEKQAEKRKNSQDQSSLQTDRMLLESTYSASSSDSETESESNEIGTGQEVLLDQMKNNTQVDQDEHAVKKSCIVSPMSIMDFYQHKVYVHYGKERHKDMSQYSFVHNQSITEGKAGDSPSKLKQVEEKKEEPKMSGFAKISLESLNKLNSNSGPFLEKEKKSPNKAEGEKADDAGNEEACSSCSVKPGVDNLPSLSDSLYDSFSSCASQGSSDI
ncbi:nck-associated protein 5-like isoform X1 [Acipenser ruthenus]|uniref:nck-associated protein 5-like isoform X1 n=3 Tax=Acipenser ruthenus TaxID=7906 RepID=UPI00145C07CC|nr:nck-associated protein 5-like isoform X1 [Acipenser ruthenus]XP_033871312.3 nck-associated protein 5-like isoform X1 [Acipenser ruthenus]